MADAKIKSEQETAEAESKKVWQIDFMMSLRSENK